MLLISRRRGERLVLTLPGVTRPVVVEVGEAGGGEVRIAVDAPKHVPVDKLETHLAKKAAAGGSE